MRIIDANDLKAEKRLLCFDLDGTLSQHKSHMPAENKAVLRRLDEKYKIIMVGAGNATRIYNQMEQFPIDIIANYGMQESAIVDGVFKIIREDTVQTDKEYFNTTCQYLREKYGYTEYAGGHLEFHSSGMVTFSLIMKYASEHGYKEEEILFIGDDFGDGGGDSHVRIKGMDYVQIDDYRKLPEALSML